MTERPILFSGPSHAHGTDGFWSRVDKSGGPDACWPWLGAKNQKGYGRRNFRGVVTLAHRAAYVISKGEVPDGFTIDHLCRNRACQNPAHLEAVPHRINLLRGNTIIARAASATHCPQGHPYDEANTKLARDGHRSCRACDNARAFEAYVPRANPRRRRPHLSDGERADILRAIAQGRSHSQIAEAFDVSIGTVSRVRNS